MKRLPPLLLILFGLQGLIVAAVDVAPSAPIGLSQIPAPWFIAHRGDPLRYPEHTLEAYRASVAAGSPFVEVDCFLLMDGSLAIMHDDTLSRTTNSDWPTGRMNRTVWSKVEVVGEKLNPMQPGRYAAPMFEDVLREFANRVVIVVEAKNAGSGAAITEMLQKHGVKKDFVLVNSFGAEELKAPKLAGYVTSFNVGSENQVADRARLDAVGFDYLTVRQNFSEETIRSLVGAGYKVIVFTLQHHYLRDRIIRLGVHGIYTDDSEYTRGGSLTGDFSISDPYSSQTWFKGQYGNRPGRSGYFAPPNRWGLFEGDSGNYANCLQGWCSPINAGVPFKEMAVSFKATFGKALSADRWVGVLFTSDDRPLVNDLAPNQPISGYHFIIRKNGVMQIYEYENGSAPKMVAEHPGEGAIQTGETVALEVSYSNGWVRFGRVGSKERVRFHETQFRFPYLFFGVKGLGAEFSEVHVRAK